MTQAINQVLDAGLAGPKTSGVAGTLSLFKRLGGAPAALEQLQCLLHYGFNHCSLRGRKRLFQESCFQLSLLVEPKNLVPKWKEVMLIELRRQALTYGHEIV